MNYPAGADTKDAPWNRPDAQERVYSIDEVLVYVSADSKEEARQKLAEALSGLVDFELHGRVREA